MKNRILSLLLCCVMLLCLMPTAAFAEGDGSTDTGKAIQIGTSQIKGRQTGSVYFGTYKQSSDGNGGYNTDPIKWRVLSNADGKLFLLSDQNLDVKLYNSSDMSITWEKSTIRSWFNGYGASENSCGTDYSGDNFIDTAFSGGEQSAIADTYVYNATQSNGRGNPNPYETTPGGNNTTDKIFLLSIEEANNGSYFPNGNGSRKSTNTAYTASYTGMKAVGEVDYWRLRSPGHTANRAAYVMVSGIVSTLGFNVINPYFVIRPAFNLDLNSVLFTSAAEGCKADAAADESLTAVADYAGSAWKLTLKDSSRSFSANVNGQTSASATAGSSVQITYSGAQTGESEYVSVLLCDSNDNVLYYGNIAQSSASGTASVTIPADLALGNYTLKVFSEQCNGDYKTDYASAFQNISLTVEPEPLLIYTAEDLKQFRDKVNSGETGAHAKLMNDIVLNDGTFDADGNYTKGASGADAEKWTPISSYSGTFDGDGHTIRGLYVVRDKFGQQSYIGLFSSVRGGTVKNVAVTGYVAVSDGLPGTAGGIAGEVYGGTVESCVNLCHVVTDISSAGGITGIAIFSSTITNCANLSEISGGIDSAEQTGGVVGALWYDSTMTNCCNAGRVTNGGGIVGNTDDDKVVNSYYLTGTAEKAAIKGNADNTAAAKSKSNFADGTVLALLQNGDAGSPWMKTSYLAAAKMTLPLLNWQTADAHEHTYVQKYNDTHHWMECACGVMEQGSEAEHSAETGICTEGIKCACGYEIYAPTSKHNCGEWVHNTTSHTRKCQNDWCGITETKNCSGGTATCTEQATCEVCHEKYGNKDPNNHTDTTEWVQTETKHTQKYTCCGAVTVAEEDHEWENGVCTECGYGCRHTYEWQSENGQYWQKCKFCGDETAKKDIPTINISGADKVCRTQDYTFSFTLLEGATDAAYGYEFIGLGDGPLTPTVDNNLYSGIIKASAYPDEESGFKLIVSAQTADGFAFSAEKTVAIQNEHTGGNATCKDKAICEICGESYGELDRGNHADMKHIDAKAATKTAEGNTEYWYCEGCGKYFADKDGAKEIAKADTVTAKLPDEKPETESPETEKPISPATGDTGNLAVWIALLLVSGGTAVSATAVGGKKKCRED